VWAWLVSGNEAFIPREAWARHLAATDETVHPKLISLPPPYQQALLPPHCDAMPSLAQLTAHLARGGKNRGLVEQCLARITDQSGEGRRVFLKGHAEPALAAAGYYDRLRARGPAPSPSAGIPLSIKDLFDITGDVTTAGSIVLKDAPAAKQDAPAVARLRAAGFIPIGRTNMTEFAFSGLGINPHYDTPRNPYERRAGR